MKSNSDSQEDRILLIAAEASSCMYAKRFISQWKDKSSNTQFFGIGDQSMKADGMQCMGLAEDVAVMGYIEVIKHYPQIRRIGEDILEEAKKNPPRFALLLDYPGFNLRFAKRLKALGVPVVYYISPQLWAWKRGRVHQVKEFVDHMMVVFPFEVDFYKKFNVESHFVGHPLLEVVEEEKKNFQEKPRTTKVLGLMPGSRKSEIGFNFSNQLQAAKKLKEKFDLDVKVLLAPTLKESDLKEICDQEGVAVDFLQAPPTQMILECDYILTASGTATLQVALCEKPMVVMYRMNPITAFLAKLLVRSVDAFCIVNLIAGKKIVPELFQEDANPQRLSQEIAKLMDDEAYCQGMLNELAAIKEKLGQGGATQNLVGYLRKKFL